MRVYHGTTKRRAARIRITGFMPRRGRVWFTTNLGYAKRRGRTQASRTNDQPEVLTCDLNLGQFGPGRALHQSHVVVIRGRVPASVLIDQRGMVILPAHLTAPNLAKMVNGILGVKPHKGISRRHAGLRRLETWIIERLKADPKRTFRQSELLALVQEWAPDVMSQFKIDPATLKAHRLPVVEPTPEPWAFVDTEDSVDERILDALMSKRPERRAQGLAMLAEADEPDLFEWCVMFLEDPSTDVRVAAIETARSSEDPEVELMEDYADDDDKRLRAAGIGFMSRHGEDRESWFRMGLTDPETHVRVSTARLLGDLDPTVHRSLFELALYDHNPKVAEMARKMTMGKGYAVEQW